MLQYSFIIVQSPHVSHFLYVAHAFCACEVFFWFVVSVFSFMTSAAAGNSILSTRFLVYSYCFIYGFSKEFTRSIMPKDSGQHVDSKKRK